MKTYIDEKELKHIPEKEEKKPQRKDTEISRGAIATKIEKIKFQENKIIPQANKSVLLKLKRGKIPIEDTLDLHGYNKSEAKLLVNSFIKKSVMNDLRCVLIITGKKNSNVGGAESVLRKNLPEWLREDHLSQLLLAHSYAVAKNGGDGARYVLLRKKNKV